jgi:hypothetical protein
MRSYISFICYGCGGRLRASCQFIGRSCACPRCRQEVVVPPSPPAEEAPMLVEDDGHQRFSEAGSRPFTPAWYSGRDSQRLERSL